MLSDHSETSNSHEEGEAAPAAHYHSGNTGEREANQSQEAWEPFDILV